MAEPQLPAAAQALLESEYDNMLSCIRCGLCLSVCPTYQQSFYEADSPRGRIAIARALTEGHLDLTPDLLQHWDSCILCDACSAICPSGVRMEHLGQALRAAVAETKGSTADFGMRAGMRWLLPNLALLRSVVTLAKIYQKSGLRSLVRTSGLLKVLHLEEAEAMLPDIESPPLVPQGQVWQAKGPQRATVSLLAGCVMSTVFGETDRATARVLAANGCQVGVPAGQGCCGALHAHRGDLKGARELARRNIDAFEREAAEAIVVNAAGCGATMKGYAGILEHDPDYAERARAFSAKVKDFSEFLVELGPYPPHQEVRVRVTYQEPCHLAHAQGIREAPRALLRAVPGLELREMAESALCCGSGALYNLTQREYSAGLRARKVRNAATTQAEVIVTANPGCLIQLQQGVREAGAPLRVVHIADLLDQAYRDG